MKILITGHKGHIGAPAMEALEKLGHEVVGYDLVDEQDILDKETLAVAMSKDIDTVVHCAAIPHPKHGDMVDYVTQNVLGTQNVVEAAVRFEVPNFVYISSTAWYYLNMTDGVANPESFPIAEDTEFTLTGKKDSYDVSKRMAEALLGWYFTNTPIRGAILRFGPANPVFQRDMRWGDQNDKTWRKRSYWGVTPIELCTSSIVTAVQHKSLSGAYHVIDQTKCPDGMVYWSNKKWNNATRS